jgi:PadR family transcriptional regulator, regulatory protein PadR
LGFKSDLDALILGVLQESPAHGYEIARRVKKLSASALELGENRLYPCLKTLEDDGFVEAEWEPQDARPPRKVYRLTADGRRELEAKRSSWVKFSDAVNLILVPGMVKEARDGKVS